MKKKILIVSVIVVLLIAAYFYFKKRKPAVVAVAEEKPASLDTHFNVQVPDTRTDSYPLNTNSKGERVKTLQLALNRLIEKANQALIFSSPGTMPAPVLVVDSTLKPADKNAVLKYVGVAYYGTTGITETQFNAIIEKSNK